MCWLSTYQPSFEAAKAQTGISCTRNRDAKTKAQGCTELPKCGFVQQTSDGSSTVSDLLKTLDDKSRGRYLSETSTNVTMPSNCSVRQSLSGM